VTENKPKLVPYISLFLKLFLPTFRGVHVVNEYSASSYASCNLLLLRDDSLTITSSNSVPSEDCLHNCVVKTFLQCICFNVFSPLFSKHLSLFLTNRKNCKIRLTWVKHWAETRIETRARLKIQVLWDVTLCQHVTSQHIKGSQMKALWSFEMLGTKSITQCHISGNLHLH